MKMTASNMLTDTNTVYDHEEDDYVPYCDAYGCLNKAYYGNYCATHNYLE